MWEIQPGLVWPGEMRLFCGVLQGWTMGVVILDVDMDVDILVGVGVMMLWECCCFLCRGRVLWVVDEFYMYRWC